MAKEGPQEPELRAEERLPWHRPEVNRLVINVDTKGQRVSSDPDIFVDLADGG